MSSALSTKTTKTANMLPAPLATRALTLIHGYLLRPKSVEKSQSASRVLFFLSSVNPDLVVIKITSIITSINEKDSDELVNQVRERERERIRRRATFFNTILFFFLFCFSFK
jgi:hypothetical protein